MCTSKDSETIVATTMSRVHREESIILPPLPIELWDEVISLCPPADQAALCALSRQISVRAIRMLYRDVTLRSARQVVICCRTLALNASVALAVRKLRFKSQSTPFFALSPFFDIVVAALKSVVLINTLELHLHDRALTRAKDCVFPSLRVFSCIKPSGPAVSSFLQRHPTLEKVHLELGLFVHHAVPPIHLPRLTSFIGPHQIVGSLVPGSSVADLLVGWDFCTDDDDFGELLKTLAPSASSLSWLGSMIWSWSPRLVYTIIHMFPYIRGLRLEVFMLGGADEWQDAMTSALSQLTNLEQLVLIRPAGRTSFPTANAFEGDLKIVNMWRSLCPSLKTCFLFSGTEWMRFHDFWIPLTVEPSVVAWWKDLALSGKLDDHLTAIWKHSDPRSHWTEDDRRVLISIQISVATPHLAVRF